MVLGYTGGPFSEVPGLLKFLIVALALALLVSLATGFFFLMKDQGDKDKRRTFHSLGVRISLAVCLMLLIVYGVATGQLNSQAPWETPPSTDVPRENTSPPRE
jgi:peptidoglycan biosynthesis protein MviN/MurJ (putative lipid II flippase)